MKTSFCKCCQNKKLKPKSRKSNWGKWMKYVRVVGEGCSWGRLSSSMIILLLLASGGQGRAEKEVLFHKYMAKFAFPDFLIAP